MEPNTIIQLRQKLESIKEFQKKNAPSRLSYFGYLGEIFIGGIILGELIINSGIASVTMLGIPHFVSWLLLAISLVLILHGLYLIFRFHSDKKIRKILEAVFEDLNRESV